MEKYLELGRKADASLSLCLSEYYRALAALEMLDPNKPLTVTEELTGGLDRALRHLESSLESSASMLEAVPGDENYKELVRMRLKAGIRNVEAFQAALLTISKKLSSSTYPSARDCIVAMSALQDLNAQAKLNAQSHEAEGF